MAISRRGFLGSSAFATAGAMGRSSAHAAPSGARKGGKLLKIGVLTCHPTHHHMPNIWGPLINCTMMRNKFRPTRMTGMELTHIWDLDPKRMASYSEEFGTAPVKSYDAMTGEVDGVIISDMRNADHFPELAEPYLRAGVPILFNRPFTSSVGRAKRIVDMSKRYGTPFMTASGWEYCKEVYAMRKAIDDWGPGIRAVSAFNSSTEVTHDVHGFWIIMAMLGTGVESVSVSRDTESIYEHGRDTWSILYGPREGSDAFYCTLNNTTSKDSNARVEAILEKGTFRQSLWYLGGDAERRYQYYFLPPLLEFQRMIERGTMPQSHEHVLEKTAVFIAGFKSHLDRGGQAVRLDELEDDYRVPSDPNTVDYPDGFFG